MRKTLQDSSHTLNLLCALDQLMHHSSLPTAITNGAIDLSCQLTAHSPSLQLLLMHITPYLLSSSPPAFATGLEIIACYGSWSQKFNSRHKQSM